MNRKPILLLALVALAALVLSAAAAGSPNRKIWCVDNLCVADDGGISPTKLPRHGKAPITAELNGEVTTKDGTHPPALQSLDLEIDKTIGVDGVGLPTCRIGQLSSRDTAAAKRACGDAIGPVERKGACSGFTTAASGWRSRRTSRGSPAAPARSPSSN